MPSSFSTNSFFAENDMTPKNQRFFHSLFHALLAVSCFSAALYLAVQHNGFTICFIFCGLTLSLWSSFVLTNSRINISDFIEVLRLFKRYDPP